MESTARADHDVTKDLRLGPSMFIAEFCGIDKEGIVVGTCSWD